MLAGGKHADFPGLRGFYLPWIGYQGMIFLIPFFFLLLDSLLESAESAFAGVCPLDWALVEL